MSPVRAAVVTILAGAGAALAVRLPVDGPFSLAVLAVGAGTTLALLSTRRPGFGAIPCGATGGVILLFPVHPSLAVAGFAIAAWTPRACRAGSLWDAVLVVAFAGTGGACAPLLASFETTSLPLAAAATLLAGIALVAPAVVPESTAEALALRRAGRALTGPARDALLRSAELADRIARSDGPGGLKERARDVAGAMAADGRSLARLGEVDRFEGRLPALVGGPARRVLADRSGDLVARVLRMGRALERAWVTGEVPAPELRLRVAEELEEESEAVERAREIVARLEDECLR